MESANQIRCGIVEIRTFCNHSLQRYFITVFVHITAVVTYDLVLHKMSPLCPYVWKFHVAACPWNSLKCWRQKRFLVLLLAVGFIDKYETVWLRWGLWIQAANSSFVWKTWKCRGIWQLSGIFVKKSSQWKLFNVNFTFGATPDGASLWCIALHYYTVITAYISLLHC